MSFVIRGLGTAVPPSMFTQEEAAVCASILSGPEIRHASWLPKLYVNSGIKKRNQVFGRQFVDDILSGTQESGSPFLPRGGDWIGPSTGERMRMYTREVGPLAVRAATAAINEAGFNPKSITHLVTVSCTGFASPGIDIELIQGLKLSNTIERTHIGFMGCHGAMNGMRVANAFTTADPIARVLICAVELCSVHYHCGNDPDKAVANAIFADGAAAIVGDGVVDHQFGDKGLSSTVGNWAVTATGSCLIPDSTEAMRWIVGDAGFEMTLSRQIPWLIAKHTRPWLENWLQDHGLTMDGIGSWAIHPGGAKILNAVEQGLRLPSTALGYSREVYADHGNMSSPTVLFVIDRFRRAMAPRPCIALGFGPGLVAEISLIR